MRRRLLVLVVAVLGGSLGVGSAAPVQAPSLPGKAQERSVDPVVLTGAQFPAWSAGPEISFREPQVPTNYGTADVQGKLPKPLRSDCYDPGNKTDPAHGDHSCDQSSRIPIRALPGRTGVPVERLRGYRWDGHAFVQIPFQADERFTRYLSNNASGFAFYSGVDQYTTYAFDREGYRFTDNPPGAGNECTPIPRKDPLYGGQRIVAEPDPIPGLDDNDEVAFMMRDTGSKAPSGAALPAGIQSAQEVRIVDRSNPRATRYAYVMLAAANGPAPAFSASNGYVRYEPDANAHSVFVFSESSYGGYGAAPAGPYCLPDGTPTNKSGQRRPLDTAWVRTPRYEFRYDGRWLMTQLHISSSAAGDWAYGPDIIDRWKARAFQQDPSSNTPCCGYEEEDTNWGGSSILLGERAGPVRVIREAWGADSSTNNVRRETFYRDQITFGDALRVHPIPPLDGIYVQWDYNAGRVSKYYNAWRPKGVAIDGQNDEVFGNLDDPCNPTYDARDSGLVQTYRETYKTAGLCGAIEYHQSVDLPDPTLSGPIGMLSWEEVAGNNGTLVTRWSLRDVTLGGAAHTLVSAPYYRDDSCFDDGTGTDPGPRRLERHDSELTTYRLPGSSVDIPRKCWTPADGMPNEAFVAGSQPLDPSNPSGPQIGDELGDERFFQGDIGTHGLHLLLVAESDNLQLTVPTTEIDSEQRMVVLPGNPGNVGETYGRSIEFPLLAIVRPLS
jgi:hypothetical protein